MVTSPGPVLVIEDDPTVRDVVVRHLERDGIDVAAVADGERAPLQAGMRWRDLVVRDLMRPRILDVALRGDKTRTPSSGAGLGLPIAKGCVEAHDGRRNVQNDAGV